MGTCTCGVSWSTDHNSNSRMACRRPTELTRRVWTSAVLQQISCSTVDRVEALVAVHGLRARVNRLETGDRKELAETRTAALEAVLAHRSARLREPPTDADRTKELDYLPLQDLSTPGKCLPWLRSRGTTGQARLRFLLRTGIAPLIVELGRHRRVPRQDRWCRLCDSRHAIEDVEHFILHCPCWADGRIALNEAVDDMLDDIKCHPAPGVTTTAAAWFRSLSASHQTRLILGAPVPGAAGAGPATSPWAPQQANRIMEGMYSVFVRGVWGMWVARGARVEQYGPRGIPIPFYRAGRWSERGVDDPESVRSTDVRSAAGGAASAGPAGGAPTSASVAGSAAG